MKYNKNILIAKLRLIYRGRLDKFPTDPTIENALGIFQHIKDFERAGFDGQISHDRELFEAKEDLAVIFNTDYSKLSKNKLFLAHQSFWVNSLYDLLKSGNGKYTENL